MRVLDIGCGWGGWHIYGEALRRQRGGRDHLCGTAKMAQRCQDLDVDIRLQDYRDLNEQFDRIVRRHVRARGAKNYDTYFEVVDRNLKPDGIFLLHTIGSKRPTITLTVDQ
jgi:cyclopropane-fatty-acyl-phospholipid synthase